MVLGGKVVAPLCYVFDVLNKCGSLNYICDLCCHPRPEHYILVTSVTSFALLNSKMRIVDKFEHA